MCGIAGALVKPGTSCDNENKVERMLAQIIHRGPDANNEFRNSVSGVIFSHCLLAISSFENMTLQPHVLPSGNVLLLNGEIYNFLQLKKSIYLSKTFGDDVSDTFIAGLFIEEFGLTEFLNQAVGMFCLVFWDKEEDKVHFFRDKFGQKPLFYAENNGSFYFCSEFLPLFSELGEIDLCKDSLAQFITLGFSEKTPAIQVKELQPNEHLCFDLKLRTLQKAQIKKITKKNLAKVNLETLFSQIMSETLATSRPTCVFLSGGLDSTAILAWSEKINGKSIDSVTLGFQSNHISEVSRAQKVASTLRSNNNLIIFSDSDVVEAFEKFVLNASQPMADPAFLALSYLCNAVKDNVVVGLTGDGADELSGGYYRYGLVEKLYKNITLLRVIYKICASFLNFLPLANQKQKKILFLLQLMNKYQLSMIDLLQLLSCHSLHSDLEKITFNSLINTDTWVNQNYESMLDFEQKYYLPSLLAKSDRASMSSSIELRSPFLDDRLYDYLDVKIKSSTSLIKNKSLIKDLIKLTPHGHLVNYPKKGFDLPLKSWLLGPLRGHVEHLINSDCSIVDELISKQHLSLFYKSLESENGNALSRLIYNYISLKGWCMKNG